MKKIRFWAAWLIMGMFLGNSFMVPSFAQQEGEANEEIKKGIYQFRQENFDEALKTFKAARTAYPDSSLAAYYLGLTYKRLENYVEARKELEASLKMTPKIKGALIELIDVLYRLDEIEAAKKWIQVAEDEGVRPAQAAFLKGLTLMKAGEYPKAVESFENAKELDETLAQPVDYQIGIAYLKQKKYKEARSLFTQIVASNPESDIASYANLYIDGIERKVKLGRPYHITLRSAFEYDSNVVLKPSDSSLASNIADQGDTREVWDGKIDYTLKMPDSFLSLRAEYAFRFSKENEIGRYSYLSNSFTLQPNMTFEKFLATFPIQYNHTIVASKNYLSQVNVGNVNSILVTESQMAQFGAFYKYNDYLRPPYGDESRTGNELAGTVGWYWFFLANQGFFNVGYSPNMAWAHGNNWEYFGNRFDAGFLVPFWKKFKFSVNGEVALQNYTNTHSFFEKKRQDQIYSLSSLLSYEIFKNIELQCQYTYVNDQSNIRLYEYSRHIVSGAVQFKF